MKRMSAFSPVTIEVARLLGSQIRAARHERRWTLEDLAERVGISRPTMQKIEAGDPSVRLGSTLEAAVLTGVPLFHDDRSRLASEVARADASVTLLPKRVRRPMDVDDRF